MPKYRTEVFGQFAYAPEISYEDLLKLEEKLTIFATKTLTDQGAEFIHFESEGDQTFFQCVFSKFDDAFFKKVSKAFAAKTSKQIECKMLFVDKQMGAISLYSMRDKEVSNQKHELPPSGPIDAAIRGKS